ncbi:hypothetical protein F5X97DRAFT_323175 [Nemania serpens]|nr:hypothetical protein F5X97DRAFT_323175 [Nemania serpens]
MFHLFAKLPPELRVIIWEMSILRHHRDRVLLLNETNKRIVCARKLACSSHFRATSESRQVAIRLYPIRLPLLQLGVVDAACFRNSTVGKDTETDMSKYRPGGAIYVSLEHDIFGIGVAWLIGFIFTEIPAIGHRTDIYENWAVRTSQALSLPQYQSVRRIMLFSGPHPGMLKDGCLRGPQCIMS